MEKIKWLNIGLRGIMETGIIFGFGYWGYHAGGSITTKIILAVFIPLIGFGFWGAVDFRSYGPYAEYIRLAQELVISGMVAAAFFVLSLVVAGWSMIVLSVLHHTLIYITGERLLKKKETNNS